MPESVVAAQVMVRGGFFQALPIHTCGGPFPFLPKTLINNVGSLTLFKTFVTSSHGFHPANLAGLCQHQPHQHHRHQKHPPGHEKVLEVAVVTKGVDQAQKLDLQGNFWGALATSIMP